MHETWMWYFLGKLRVDGNNDANTMILMPYPYIEDGVKRDGRIQYGYTNVDSSRVDEFFFLHPHFQRALLLALRKSSSVNSCRVKRGVARITLHPFCGHGVRRTLLFGGHATDDQACSRL
jgi:hypothetical protein